MSGKAIHIVIGLIFFHSMVFAQIPSTCFEIESILVDACGDPEGENEMVRFVTGPFALNTNDLDINWPNNPYRNICQNATTASHVATLNASILACGRILEPPGGIIPPGSTVLLVTSTAMNPAYNSFAGLTDTIYMIFQCPGNTSGHFRNYSLTTAVRTLRMEFLGLCSDQVSYDASMLVDQNGIQAVADGSTVEYDFNGNATYINPGCQAPIAGLQVSLSASSTTMCAGDLISLTAVLSSGNFNSYFWTGGTGVYSNPTQLNTLYQTDPSYLGPDQLRFGVVGICNDTFYTPININISSSSVTAAISTNGPTDFCAGDSVVLTASPGISYIWSGGDTTQSITVYSTGTYSVNITGQCGSALAFQTINVSSPPVTSITPSGPTTFCQGGFVNLFATGTGPFLWSTGDNTQSITVSASDTYTVSVSNSCGADNDSITVSVDEFPDATISGAPTLLCPGESAIIITGTGTNYLWSDGSTNREISISTGGTYTVSVSNSCGTDIESVVIGSSVLDAAFSADTLGGAVPLNVTFLNNTFGGSTFTWNFGDGTISTELNPQHSFLVEGDFPVTLTATDAQGCNDSYTIVIRVTDDTQINIPNSFTPNGDGKNEYFNLVTNKTNLVILGRIFNRWGGEIANWDSLSSGWDGRSDTGTEVAEGVYVYLIEITHPDGEVEKRNGAVSVIR